ncbi:MAG: DUF438 domain-containing protein [Spirochaetales bacterium]|nr:DUF438 domain-containing protein [Spirochaetales bacterium]
METSGTSQQSRNHRLAAYLKELYQGSHSLALYEKNAEVLETATPAEVNGAIDTLIREHDDFDRIEDAVARFIRAAGKGLDSRPAPEVPAGHFLSLLLLENRGLKAHLRTLSAAFKAFTSGSPGTEVRKLLKKTLEVSSHYQKIQYAVFPAMEDHTEAFNCTKLMWHLQDTVLAGLKDLLKMLEEPEAPDYQAFNRLFGKTFLRLGALAYREEKVLFPVVLETVPAERFDAMTRDLEEYGTSFGVDWKPYIHKSTATKVKNEYISKVKQEASMSEHIQNHEERKKQLKAIILGLKDEADIPLMKKRFAALLKDLSPEEIAAAEQALIDEGMPVEDVQKLCEVHVAAFQDALHETSGDRGKTHNIPGHPVHTYREENKQLKKHLKALKQSLRGTKLPAGWDRLGKALQTLKEVEIHFARKENQLFPFLENAGFSGPSKVMWGKHDEIRGMMKELGDALEKKDPSACRSVGGRLIRSLRSLIVMEEKILFPTSLRKLPEEAWAEIRRGESEIGYAWITPGNLYDPSVVSVSSVPSTSVPTEKPSGEIDLSEGKLLPDQIDLMLRNLPVDITYVDENDKVRYYSQGKERIFPRSPGIIGRSVQNCHPPKSVHVVQKIVEDFKARRREVSDFWLEMNGRFIFIRYFALFEGDTYRGVLEVSQDVTDIRKLEGEKRLLDEE